MAQFGFFLHFYPDAHRQSWANVPTGHQGRSCSSENRRIYFPQPDWLKLRVAANLSLSHHDPANLESEPEFEAAEKFWMKYFAIVKVKTVWQDLLTHLDEEEFLGFQFFQYPSDYFTEDTIQGTGGCESRIHHFIFVDKTERFVLPAGLRCDVIGGLEGHHCCWTIADAVAKRYRPWPKGLRADSLPWFDSPLVQGASRLRYTDKAQMQRPGHTGRKALATKKTPLLLDGPEGARGSFQFDLCFKKPELIFHLGPQ